MKKSKLLLGVTTSALGVLALASCGEKKTKSIDTNLKGVEEVTSEVIKGIVEDDTYKTNSYQTKLVKYDGYEYSSISSLSSNYFEYRTSSSTGKKTVYSKLVDKDICEIGDDFYSIRDVSYNYDMISVITVVEGEEISYNYDVYDYLGKKVISYQDSSTSKYRFSDSTSSYYDEAENYHVCRKYSLTTTDGEIIQFYQDYCEETNTLSYSTSNPQKLNLLKPGYFELKDGLYIRREALTDGVQIHLYDDNTEYAPLKLPANSKEEVLLVKDKIIYQTEKVLPDDATSYSYYIIDQNNGETIKYELKSYMYDYKTATLTSLDLPYIADSLQTDEDSDYVAAKFVKVVNGELNEDLNSIIGFINSEGSIKYTSEKDLDFASMIELDSGYYYDEDSNYVLYDQNLNFVTKVGRRINANLFLDYDNHRIFDKNGIIVKEFKSYNSYQTNIATIDDEKYEIKGSSLVLIGSDEIINNGWIYKFTELDSESLATAKYKIEARIPGESVSVVYYSNYKAMLSIECSDDYSACFSSDYTIYSTKELDGQIRYILVK